MKRKCIGALQPGWMRVFLGVHEFDELPQSQQDELAMLTRKERSQLFTWWQPRGWQFMNHIDRLQSIPAAALKMYINGFTERYEGEDENPVRATGNLDTGFTTKFSFGETDLEVLFQKSQFLGVTVRGFNRRGEIDGQLIATARYGNIWKDLDLDEELPHDGTIKGLAHVIIDHLSQMDPVMGGSGVNVMANEGLASWGVYGLLNGSNDAMVLDLIQNTTLPSDPNLRDYNTYQDAINGGVTICSAAGYARKNINTAGGSGSTVAVDDPTDTKSLDYGDQTFAGLAAGQIIAKLFHGYDDDIGAGTNANIVPISWHDLDFTLDGSDVILSINQINRAA